MRSHCCSGRNLGFSPHAHIFSQYSIKFPKIVHFIKTSSTVVPLELWANLTKFSNIKKHVILISHEHMRAGRLKTEGWCLVVLAYTCCGLKRYEFSPFIGRRWVEVNNIRDHASLPSWQLILREQQNIFTTLTPTSAGNTKQVNLIFKILLFSTHFPVWARRNILSTSSIVGRSAGSSAQHNFISFTMAGFKADSSVHGTLESGR
jgi:hypothetical protein